MRKLLAQYRELLSYVFWGAATTLVNYGVYFLCTRPLRADPILSNGAAWAVSVAFAFVVNKLLVFASASWEARTALRELGQFVSARVLSGALETLALYLFVNVLGFDDGPVKLLAGVGVIVFNYVVSKLVIFRKGR